MRGRETIQITVSEPDNQSNNVLREWRENAEYWREHYITIRTLFAPVTRALIEEAKITAGNVILDVAGGSGEPSLTIAELVGPGGSVTCTDAVAEMVSAAKSEAEQRGLTNVEFQQCLADSLPFEDNHFDATVCRLGPRRSESVHQYGYKRYGKICRDAANVA